MSEKYTALDKSSAARALLGIKDPTVVMHVHPDADTVGTAAALIRVFEKLGVKAEYACADKIPERLTFLTEGLVQSAGALSQRTLVCVDVASPSQMGSLFGLGDVSLILDHHEVGEPFAPYYTVGGASSAAEVLFGVIEELILCGKITLTPDIAYPLYAALSSDTGRFSYSSATPESYRMAAKLIETGIDHAEINHLLFSSKPEQQIRAEGLIASKIELYENGKIAAATLTKNDRTSIGIEFEHFETAIDIVRSVRGAEIAFIIKETDDGKFKASLRSTKHDVASVAKQLSGGGHKLAAGCTVNADDVGEALAVLLEKTKPLLAGEL